MFSMGKTDPRLYNRTLASAGMSCVVVTSTFTQLLLQDTDRQQKLVCKDGWEYRWRRTGVLLDRKIADDAFRLINEQRGDNCNKEWHLELMMDRDFSAWLSQESVRASISARSCSQASLLAGPSRPTAQKGNHTLMQLVSRPLKQVFA